MTTFGENIFKVIGLDEILWIIQSWCIENHERKRIYQVTHFFATKSIGFWFDFLTNHMEICENLSRIMTEHGEFIFVWNIDYKKISLWKWNQSWVVYVSIWNIYLLNFCNEHLCHFFQYILIATLMVFAWRYRHRVAKNLCQLDFLVQNFYQNSIEDFQNK